MKVVAILKIAGKQRLEVVECHRSDMIINRLRVTDDWLSNWILVFECGRWFRDSIFAPNKPIEKYLNINSAKLCEQYKLQQPKGQLN